MPEFKIVEVRECHPSEWLAFWTAMYNNSAGYDEVEYAELISLAKQESFPKGYFERLGRWKDAANSDGRWKPNVASVAYLTWVQAETEQPRCPMEHDTVSFLENWSNRAYVDVFSVKRIRKIFGLSRATTLLHFLSGSKFPIYDSNVIRAMSRLNKKRPLYTVNYYWNTFYPQFLELANKCETEDFRALDKALFSYGATSSIQ